MRQHPAWLAYAGALILAGTFAAPEQSTTPGKGAGPRLGPITTVEIAITNRSCIGVLSDAGFDLEAVKDNRVVLYADEDELAALRAEGWDLNILETPPGSPSSGQ